MKIFLASVMVDDQEKALYFYTDVLGFVKRADIPAGRFRWLTVVSAESTGLELVLEPNEFPAARAYQQAAFAAGIPAATFGSLDVPKEYERLTTMGVVFRKPPTKMGPVTVAVFDDTCGNYIQIAQKEG